MDDARQLSNGHIKLMGIFLQRCWRITGKQSLGLAEWAGPQLVIDGSGVARQSRFTSHDWLFKVDMATDGIGGGGELRRQGPWGTSEEDMRKRNVNTHKRRACYGMTQRICTSTRLFVGNLACRQTFETSKTIEMIKYSMWYMYKHNKKNTEKGFMGNYREQKGIVPCICKELVFSCLKVDWFKISFCVLFVFSVKSSHSSLAGCNSFNYILQHGVDSK